MLRSLFGYFFCMIIMLTAVAVLMTSFPNVSTIANGRNHLRRPVIARTVTVEIQRHRHSQVAKREVPAKDVTQVVASAKADTKVVASAKADTKVVASAKTDTKKIKHSKPKVFARQPSNYGYGNALGYAAESGYSPRGPFFR